MRIVDEHGDAAVVEDFLQPAGNRLEIPNAVRNRTCGNPERARRSNRAEYILQIGCSDQRRFESNRLVARLDRAAQTGDVTLDLERMDVPLALLAVAPEIGRPAL